jgi:hypothetical protein
LPADRLLRPDRRLNSGRGEQALKILAKLAALALVWPAAQAAGQAVPAPLASLATPPAVVACELHVWPAARMTKAYDSNNFLYSGSVTIKSRPGFDGDALMLPAAQNRVLATMDLAKMLGIAAARIVLHETPLSADQRQNNARRAQASAPCYAELIVLRIVYAGIFLGDRLLQTFFIFRRFDAGSAPTREFTQSGETVLHIFPPHDQEPVAPALAELDAAFRANVTNFAGKLGAPPAPMPVGR